MGVWKVQVSFRISPDLHWELEEAAVGERRTLGSFGRLLIEWAFERHKKLGSSEKLLRCRIRPERRVKKIATSSFNNRARKSTLAARGQF
jgi:hypothetical protein